MIDGIAVESMSEEFLLWRCLHGNGIKLGLTGSRCLR